MEPGGRAGMQARIEHKDIGTRARRRAGGQAGIQGRQGGAWARGPGGMQRHANTHAGTHAGGHTFVQAGRRRGTQARRHSRAGTRAHKHTSTHVWRHAAGRYPGRACTHKRAHIRCITVIRDRAYLKATLEFYARKNLIKAIAIEMYGLLL